MNASATASTDTRFDTLRTGIAIVDQEGAIVYANPAFAKRLNASTLGDSIDDIPFTHPDAAPILARKLRDVGESALTFDVADDRAVTLYIGTRDAGRRIIVAATGWPRSGDASSDLVAHLDPLTGFGNRLMYDARIGSLETPRDRERLAAVLVVDLDNFKQVNDTLGHGTGDELLTLVARYAFFEPRLETQALERRDFELDLRRALGLRQFSLFYQPQTSIADNRVSGFEALIRWDHPVRGRVSPADFIPLAEEIGEIKAIGNWVIRSACEEAMRWADQTLSVAVNVSPAQFANDDLINVIRNALDKTGLAPERLEIEITEGLLLDQSKEVMQRLWAIKNLGVAIAMDDFGTGYASLSFLNSFPFSRIKIDKSFIQADDSPRSKALVCGILSMSASLGMITVAEGVETSAQYSEIARGGCGIAQGYYIAKPMPASEISDFLESFTLLDVLSSQA